MVTAEHSHDQATIPGSAPVTFTIPYNSPAWARAQRGTTAP
ncbi:MAG: hypothetical protein ACLQVK_03285 [Acidimicrobiales bacterium]